MALTPVTFIFEIAVIFRLKEQAVNTKFLQKFNGWKIKALNHLKPNPIDTLHFFTAIPSPFFPLSIAMGEKNTCMRGWTGDTLSHLSLPFSWKHKMKNKSGLKSIFLYFYYLLSTFLNSCFLNDHFHHLSLSPSSWQGKLNLLSYLFTFILGGGISFLPFYKFLLSHFPPLCHPTLTSLASFSHLLPPFLPPPFLLSAPSCIVVWLSSVIFKMSKPITDSVYHLIIKASR